MLPPTATVPVADFTTATSAIRVWSATTTPALAALFAAFGSGSVAVTEAAFRKLPRAAAVAAIVMLAPAPLARAPRLQVIVAVPVQLPWLGVAVASVRPAGSVSVTVTFVASDGPAFATSRVNVAVSPSQTEAVAAVLRSETSAPRGRSAPTTTADEAVAPENATTVAAPNEPAVACAPVSATKLDWLFAVEVMRCVKPAGTVSVTSDPPLAAA